ncbi:hypothetical protein BT96DRAFT_456938 [Gymnopus androsaceus JB14]|uniref:Uncharacterized protein n=1 Tax=Gymnopus androsaceus JB14 TaxID=1447944 RepID=A0A6A4GRM1_9AGAR|nr:hypothetical protein BT96DRAFT_456938 [Gymnopus androsaceus JB14]
MLDVKVPPGLMDVLDFSNPSGLNPIYAGTPCLLRHHNPSFIPCRLFFSYIRRDGRFEKFFETSAHTDANLDSNSTATSNTLRIHRERHYSITPNYWIFTISRSLYVVCGLGCGCVGFKAGMIALALGVKMNRTLRCLDVEAPSRLS